MTTPAQRHLAANGATERGRSDSEAGEGAGHPRHAARAALFAAPSLIETVQVAVPEPGPGDVRVKLEGCGVCASNVPVYEGRTWFEYPMEPGAPGHEGWGKVDAVGDGVTSFAVGDRVAVLSQHSYAEYDIVPTTAMLPLPSSPDTVPFPGEPLACAMNIFARSEIHAGQTVAIVGIGFLGALLVQLASHAGARVIAISRRDFALEVARRYGAAETVPMLDHWQIIEQVKELTGGAGCPRVIEATGKQWPLDLSAELTEERGRLIIAGYHQDGPRQVNMQLWNWRGLDVINAHERDPQVCLEGMRSAIKAVEAGALDPTPLFTHSYPLEELPRALQDTMEHPNGFLKALIRYE